MSTDSSSLATESSASRLPGDALADSVVLMLVMTVLQRLIGFGRGVLFCRWLGPEQLGQWDVAFGFLNLAAPLVVLGLPGSFGRYVGYYGQRQQLRMFLRRTSVLSGLSAVAALLVIGSDRAAFSQLIFGRRDQGDLVLWIALTLATVIGHNFLCSLFMALRMYRVVTALQFFQSLGFALASIALCFTWQMTAASVVLGYGIASLVTGLGSLVFLRGVWRNAPNAGQPAPARQFWSRLMPFAVWLWMSNLLANLFEVIDRYMIVHFSGLPFDEALRQVGYYHSSRLVPLLYVAVAGLLGTMITPHLTHDWEAGRRDAVGTRLNTVLKTLSLALFAASCCVLWAGPLLFSVAFGGKYADGISLLPLTLTYCTWFGLIGVAQNYLWCAEKAWLSSLALALGLAVNVGLDLVLLPRLGLHGAVWATTAANFVALGCILLLNHHWGMSVQLGTWLLALAPLSLLLGAWPATAVLLIVMSFVLGSDRIFTRTEKQEWFEVAAKYKRRLSPARKRHESRPPTVQVPSI